MASFIFSPAVELELTRSGEPHKPEQIENLRKTLDGGVTDLWVVCHGWNNDMDEARKLYNGMTASLESRMKSSPKSYAKLRGRKFAVLRVLWPSKRFAEESLIPGGGASSADSRAAVEALVAQVRALLPLFDGANGDEADSDASRALHRLEELAPLLETSEDAQDQFVRLLRSLLPASVNEEEEVLEDEFYALDGPDLLRRLGRDFKRRAAAQGGAANEEDQLTVAAAGGPAALGDLFSGVLRGARNLLNLFTYYEMKERAGLVGIGLSKALQAVHREGLRIHLAGHSFGARAVSAALAYDDYELKVCSIALLQGAFSHWGFAENYEGQKDGFFRKALSPGRLLGPMIVTHTANDWAVGLAYPIASRLRRQVASGLGDANDPYGGIGRNGAQLTPELEAHEATLRPVHEPYARLSPGKICNLHASTFIGDHGDVDGEEVAHAILSAMEVFPPSA